MSKLNTHSSQSKHPFIGESVRHSLAEGTFLFNKMEEIWREIKGTDGRFYVSNNGRVKRVTIKSKKFYYRMLNNVLIEHENNHNTDKILNLCNRNNYYSVTISGSSKYVHRLVAQAFICNPDNKTQVNHKNFNRQDNRVENLEWVTQHENVKHTVKNDLHARGSRMGYSKLTENDVLAIRKIFISEKYITHKNIAKMFNVSRTTISLIVSNKTWRHI